MSSLEEIASSGLLREYDPFGDLQTLAKAILELQREVREIRSDVSGQSQSAATEARSCACDEWLDQIDRLESETPSPQPRESSNVLNSRRSGDAYWYTLHWWDYVCGTHTQERVTGPRKTVPKVSGSFTQERRLCGCVLGSIRMD